MELQNFISNINEKTFENYQNIKYGKKIHRKFITIKGLILNKYYIYKLLILLLLLLIMIYSNIYIKNDNLRKYKLFIKDCKNNKNFKKYNISKSKNPYISICLPVYNMQKFIESALLSIIRQSFENFEIIIVNDKSNDNTEKIINKFQLYDNRIRIINHKKNLGVYRSRADGIKNAKGKYILLMDPDDMILNPDLFKALYIYNSKYNLDIIEFTVYYKRERSRYIYLSNNHEDNHYHEYNKTIINQPELSNIIFFNPKTKQYSSVICRIIWNKLIKNKVLLKSINYIDKDFGNNFLITADDTPINIISFNFAKNFSNINLPGYLYNLRTNSMSRTKNGNKQDIIISINYLLYYKLFYRYIKDFKKNINYLYYDLRIFYNYLLKIKTFNLSEYIPIVIHFCKDIIKNESITNEFKQFIEQLLLHFI